MIIALSGRRIDAPDAAVVRFPLGNVGLVRGRLRELFVRRNASALVCSAACGADLLALEVAGDLGLHRRIVIPFSRDRFRETSVVDRPGGWGSLYDRTCDEVSAQGELIQLGCDTEDEAAYALASTAVLREAAEMQSEAKQRILAVMVWEGTSRGDGDVTAVLGDEAKAHGIPVESVSTI